MLRLSKVTPGGHAYYLEVAGGGAGTGVEAPGSWVGAGAASLGLSGHVLGPELEAVLAGRDPATDAVLGRAHHRVRVAAFDLTFCAPKSVSLLHALGGPESRAAVAESHVAAVDAALAYMERHALAVRRSSAGGRTVEPAGGTAVAGFVHRTSRALDPHLHTHAVAANLACAPDGTWSALDGRGVYAHAPAAGAVYHAQLRYELTSRLGVAWEPLDRGRADVAGIGPEARRAFSVRSTQIAAHLAERGLGGHRAHELAAARTRAAKDPTRSVEDLAPWWRERAEAVGLGPRRLAAVIDRVPRRAPELPGPDQLGHTVVGALAGSRSVISRRDLVRASCGALGAGAPLAWVEAAADRVVAGLDPAPDSGPRRDGPGVGERRLRLDGQWHEQALSEGRVRDARAERRALDDLLRQRSMAEGRGHDRRDTGRDRGRDIGRDIAPGIGEGLGLG